MTPQERHLWYDFLKDLPIQFRRQKQIGPYIVDFYCYDKGIVIEIDGSQHYEPEAVQYDARRDDYLRSLGLKVMRFSNLDINLRFREVCQTIWNELG